MSLLKALVDYVAYDKVYAAEVSQILGLEFGSQINLATVRKIVEETKRTLDLARIGLSVLNPGFGIASGIERLSRGDFLGAAADLAGPVLKVMKALRSGGEVGMDTINLAKAQPGCGTSMSGVPAASVEALKEGIAGIRKVLNIEERRNVSAVLYNIEGLVDAKIAISGVETKGAITLGFPRSPFSRLMSSGTLALSTQR
jgi:hypothetical protein